MAILHEILKDYATFISISDPSSFVKICLEFAQLCSFNQDIPISQRSERCLLR